MPTSTSLSVNKKSGFTLIELLVVISIMGILATFIFINYKNSSSDRDLNKGVSNIQSFLRLAQSNATTGVVCEGLGGAYWGVSLGSDKIKLACGQDTAINFNNPKKVADLEDVKVDSIGGFSCPPVLPLNVVYAPLNAKLTFTGYDNCTKPTINLTSNKDSSTKSFTIEKGGAVDVE